MRDAALGDTTAWDIIEGLTTEVGPRPAGTPAEARARDWAVKALTALGFANVRAEPYTMPVWLRGEERAEVTAPFPQKLAITALGNSASTGPKGLEAEIVYFPTLADLRAAPDGSLAGKIAFVSHRMTATQDGSSYGAFGPARFGGPNIAAKKGAVGIVIRSVGTDYHRNPHTGATNFDAGVTPIPAGALSVPDAEQLERILKRGQPVKLRLLLTPTRVKEDVSGNVIAEVPGSDPGAGLVVVACHLDSWDLGTGAIDDAAGCGIVAAAAKRVMEAGTPRRTIRILWAGSEEIGSWGAKAYFAAHKDERHATASESDFGADRIWKFDVNLPEGARPIADRLAAALAPLGIARGAGNRRRRHRCRSAAQGGRRRNRPGAIRDTLFRSPPHARRHARQDRPGPAAPEWSRHGRRCSRSSPTRRGNRPRHARAVSSCNKKARPTARAVLVAPVQRRAPGAGF